MSSLYWQEGKVWQRVIQKIVKASVQVTMSAISMTRFLDPIPPVFPPKTFGTDFLSSDIVGCRSAGSSKIPSVSLGHVAAVIVSCDHLGETFPAATTLLVILETSLY